jgi:hypothetical protein
MKKKLDIDLADGEISCTDIPKLVYDHMLKEHAAAKEFFSASHFFKHVELKVNDGSTDKVFMIYFEHKSGDSTASKLCFHRYIPAKLEYIGSLEFEIHAFPKWKGWSAEDGNISKECLTWNMNNRPDSLSLSHPLSVYAAEAIMLVSKIIADNKVGHRTFKDHSLTRAKGD